MSLPTPQRQWDEPTAGNAALVLSRWGWHYDGVADEYTLTADAALETHRLADVGGTGDYALTPVGALSAGTPILRVKQAGGGDINVY
jgi:hypothetical protein